MLDHLRSGNKVLLMVEVTYNNSFEESIGMQPLETFYGRGVGHCFNGGIKMVRVYD